jgi:gliding motility-associated-like protein
MRKQAIICVVMLFAAFSFASAQINNNHEVLSTDPHNPELIMPSDDLVFNEYTLSPDENIELPVEDALRMYYPQNYYAQFNMPSNHDIHVFIKYAQQEDLTVGLAAYAFTGEGYNMIKQTHVSQSPGMFRIRRSDFQAGDMVTLRLWFSDDMTNETVEIAVRKQESSGMPKLISVDQSTYTPQELVQDVLISGCLQAENVAYTGDPISIGYFSGAIGTSGFDEGIVMCSGDATEAAGPDDATSEGSSTSGGSDPDLEALIPGFTVNDAAVLEFDFIPASDTLKFEYIFGSEEFPEFANSSFNDAFGFFLSGPGINGPYSNNAINIALLPNGQPVTIDNVFNSGIYYVKSTSGSGGEGLAYNNDIEYDGATIPLIAEAQVQMCETYHIKLAIGDAGDSSYDSGVFFKAGSFTSGMVYTVSSFNPWYSTDEMYEGCQTLIIFNRTDTTNIDDQILIPLDVAGDADMNADYSSIPDTAIIPANMMADTLVIEAFTDGIADGGEEIILSYEDGCPCDSEQNQLIITILDELEPVYSIDNSGPICLGDTGTLVFDLDDTSIDPNLIDWEWIVDGTTNYTTDVTPTTTTTYQLAVTYPCFTDTIETTLEVVPPPDVDLGPDYTNAGNTADLGVNPAAGNTGYWTVISGPGNAVIDDSTSANTSVTVDSLGIYEFVWTEISLPPDCLDSDTVAIEFFHVPTPDFEITPAEVCFGDTILVTYTGNGYDWAEYTWDFDGATIISGDHDGPYELVYDVGGTQNISLEVDELGYTVDTTISYLYPPLLEYDLEVNDDPCFESCNGSVSIDVEGGVPPYDYSWGPFTEIQSLCEGDYGITVTDTYGCTAGQQYTIDQPTELVYDTAYQHVDCYGSYTGMAEIIPSGGVQPYTYTWSNSANTGQLDGIPAGDYDVTVTDANGCTVSEGFTITEPDELLVSFNDDIAICQGQEINLIATPIGGTAPYTIFWNDGSGYSTGPTGQSVSPDSTTTYTVYVVDAHGCVSPVQQMTLTVSPHMSLGLDLTNNTCYNSCDGKAVLTVHGGIEPFDFSWTSDSRILTDLCSGLYDVMVVDQIGCTADTVFFIDQPDSLRYDIFSESATCAGLEDGQAWVEVTGGSEPYNYEWSTGDTTDTITATGGVFTVTISDAHNCRQFGQVTIDAPQAISVYPDPDPTICIGSSATISADVMGGSDPYNYTWMDEDSTYGYDHVFTVSPTETSDYYLTVTDDNGCTGQASMTVNVHPPLSIDHVNANKDTVCENSPITVYVEGSGGNGGPYTMSLQNGEIVPSEFILVPEESQWWYLTLRDECGTPPVTDSIFIPVWETPPNDFVSDKIKGCPPLLIQFSELNEGNGYSYRWNYGDDGFGFIKNPKHIYEESGIFDVTLTVKDKHGCKNTRTREDMIEVYPKPDVDFYADPKDVSILDPDVTFVASYVDVDSLFWFFGDGDSSTWNHNKPTHIYKDVGEFEVMLVAENWLGCRDTIIKNVNVSDHFSFYAPEVFTPNGDGANDCFRVCGNGIDPNDFYLVVHDRWGEVVFETDKYYPDKSCHACGEGAWDGTFNGNRMEGDELIHGGMFLWYSKFKDTYGNFHEYTGFIRLRR